MPELKLARLPDRTPVKLMIQITPDLSHALADYAALYRETYGQNEGVAELIPPMLQAFIESDRAFIKARTAARAQVR